MVQFIGVDACTYGWEQGLPRMLRVRFSPAHKGALPAAVPHSPQ